METVAFYSFKGGVGRSLLLANTARFLALCGARVVALDLDLEAPGLHYKLGVPSKLGALDFLNALLADRPAPALSDLLVPVPVPVSAGGSLHLLCAGDSPSSSYFASLHVLNQSLHESRGRWLLESALELQARIEEERAPDYLLIDARTGVTEFGGLATTALADRVVLLFTPHRESWEGAAAVYQALREAPTLEGRARRFELLLTRVQEGSPKEEEALRQTFGTWTVLPQDPLDGGSERAIGAGPRMLPRRKALNIEASQKRSSLLSASLKWMAQAFPKIATIADAARRRTEAVDGTVVELMRTGILIGTWYRPRRAWKREQLQFFQEFKDHNGKRRLADVIVQDDTSLINTPKLLMVIEFVADEDLSTVAHWWLQMTPAMVVVLLHGQSGRTLYSQSQRNIFPPVPSNGNSLPTPTDFDLLPDPTDHSLDAILAAAHKTREYNHQIIVEWVHSQHMTISGGRLYNADKARKIMDSIATIEDPVLANIFVAESTTGASHRNVWIGDGNGSIDEYVHQELCAPLCWRIPPQGFVIISRQGIPFGIQLIARLLGLTYDPEAVLGRELKTSRSFAANSAQTRAEDLLNKYALSFHWIKTVPPLEDVADLISAETALRRRLPYHGFLGRYDDSTGRVELYQPRITELAATLQVAERHLGSVTLLHLSILGVLHVAVDLDGEWWPGFSAGPLNPWTGGLPLPLVALTQLVMHQVLTRLQDDKLREAFEAMCQQQPPEYRLWHSLRHLSQEQTRAWAVALRRGESTTAIPDLRALLQQVSS